MKKALTILLSLLFAAWPLTACAKDPADSFASSPEEEYRRIASLAGEGIVFDIDTLPSFEVSHTGSFISDKIYIDGAPASADISALYQCDPAPDKEKSYAKYDYIYMFSETGENTFSPAKPENPPAPQGYFDGAYYWGTGRTPDVRAYKEILALADSHGIETPDTIYRKTLALLSAEALENFDGGKSSGTYTVTADVKADAWPVFEEWLKNFYYYLKLYADDIDAFAFFDFENDFADSAEITIRTTKQALTDVVLRLDTYGKYGMGELRFEAKTTFKTGRVSVKNVTEEQ